MARNFYTSSPTVVLPPQQPTSYFADHGHGNNGFTDQSVFSNPSPFGPPSAASFSMAMPSPLTPNSVAAGRKRSRADITESDEQHDEDGSLVIQPVEPPKSRGEPVYGPGMTLVYPDDPGFSIISAASQTGTWLEEAAAKAKEAALRRPSLTCRKSQRLDRTATGLANAMLAGSPATMKGTPAEPTVDDATHALGIGWMVVRNNPTLEITSKAYAKFIENHYPLSSVEILLHSKSMPAYLVSANREGQIGFYLFEEDLKRGQLLAFDFNHAVKCLQTRPIAFANDEILVAARSPSMSAVAPSDTAMMDGMASDPSNIVNGSSDIVAERDMMLD
ncbi:MAG: hypothetical protein M1820_005954 [Bogoriella megaspora]|nr:MAG: hypothetical protein M1820_005954 [Bogoriella megaspora]